MNRQNPRYPHGLRRKLGLAALMASCAGLAGCSLSPAIAPSEARQQSGPLTAATISSNLATAKAARLKGDYTASLKILSQLLLASPDDGRIVGEYGKVLAQQGRSREAVTFLTRALVLMPNDWTFASALGVAQDQAGDADKAAEAYERALKLRPDAPEVLNNYALSRMMAGDVAKAQALIEIAARGSSDPKIKANQAIIADYAAKAPQPAELRTEPPKPAPQAKVAQKPLPPPTANPAPPAKIEAVATKDKPRKRIAAAPQKPEPKSDDSIPSLRLTADVK